MKVRTDILRLAKELHTWVGICAGILLFICFFAGGLSMFQHDLSKWATPPQQSLNTVELHQYNDLVLQVQQHYPEAKKSFQINLNSKEFYYAPIQWQPAKSQAHDDHAFDTDQSAMLATFKPDGTLQVEQENLSKLGWLIEQLHDRRHSGNAWASYTRCLCDGCGIGLIFFGANDRFNHPLADVG